MTCVRPCRSTAVFSLFAIILAAPLFGQVPDTLWSRTYGGANIDIAYSVYQTSDGGYVAAGYTNSFGAGQQDAYLVKTNHMGDTVWTATFGGAAMDGAHFVREANGGGYILAGYTESYGGAGKNVYLIRTDTAGTAEYTRTYSTSLMDVAYAFCATPDGGYMFVGYKNGPSGWAKGDLWILKTDGLLDTLWTKTYGGAGEDYGVTIQPAADSGYIICGSTTSFGSGGKDAWLVKIDEDGDTMWTKTYGGALEDVAYGVSVTADGGYVISGYINGTGAWTAGDLWLVKTDHLGETLWTAVYGVIGEDYGWDVYQTADNGYITAGQGSGDIWLLRTDALGDTLWTKRYGGAGAEAALALSITSDGGYIIAGYTTSFGAGSHDFWVLKIGPDVGINENAVDIVRDKNMAATIFGDHVPLQDLKQYRIYDISGRIVSPYRLAPGIYFMASPGKILKKIVKVR